MSKHNTAWFVLFWALFLVLISTVAVAQNEEQSAEDTKPASEQAEPSEDSAEFVYTTDYLKKRVAETEEQTTGVTNRTLDEQFAEPVQTAGTAFTNDDLQDRFGEEGEEATEDETSETEETAQAEPTEPAMSDAERAELMAELEAKIGELQQQLDELREE